MMGAWLARCSLSRAYGPRPMGVVTIHKDGAAPETSGPGLGEWGESPLGGAPVGALEDQQCLLLLDLAVGVPLPVRSRRYADVPVEVKKRCLETLLSISLQKLLVEPKIVC